MSEQRSTERSAERSTSRSYTSTLRERQVAQTREIILDALTELLGERRADEVTTRDLAATAGVSERTVYRHFPDRAALLDGLSERLSGLGPKPSFLVHDLDELCSLTPRLMAVFEEHFVLARAEAVFNADPRRFGAETRTNTRDLRELVARGLPELDERDQLRIAAVIRTLASSQAWLRMREEFGVPGTESGPVVAWVIDMIVREARAGNLPAVT